MITKREGRGGICPKCPISDTLMYVWYLFCVVFSEFPVNHDEWRAQQTTVGSFQLSPGDLSSFYKHTKNY